MPATEIPPRRPVAQPPSVDGGDLYDAQRWETAYREMHNVPALLIQLQDDLSRSRRREAFWISVVVHLVLVIFIVNLEKFEKYFPGVRMLSVKPQDFTRDKELTYLEQPPDLQKLTKKQDSNIISDKDRVATSRAPKLDPKELQQILEKGRPGAPGTIAPPQPPVAAQNPPEQQPPQQSQQPKPQVDDNQNASLRLPQTAPKPTFNTGSMSAGNAVEQAARAALTNPRYGVGGDYGLGQGRQASKAVGELDVLSDTMGVDFDPYLKRVLNDVRMNWYNLIPEAARAPLMKRGKVSIEFAILKNGRVAGLTLASTSGDVSLDRAAWGGITASNPFPPLPGEFRGEYLALRFHFYYNPDSTDLH